MNRNVGKGSDRYEEIETSCWVSSDREANAQATEDLGWHASEAGLRSVGAGWCPISANLFIVLLAGFSYHA